MPIEIKWVIPKDVIKEKFNRAWSRTVDDTLDGISDTASTLIEQGPFNEGNLLRSVVVWRTDELTGFIGYTAPYAKPVEFGSAPHFPPPDAIREWARNKLGLWGARLERATRAIVWKIFHYGTKPQPFLRPAVEMERPKVAETYRKHLAKEGLA